MIEQTDSSSHVSPPLFRTWRRWYLVVIVELVVVIIVSYIITAVFR